MEGQSQGEILVLEEGKSSWEKGARGRVGRGLSQYVGGEGLW